MTIDITKWLNEHTTDLQGRVVVMTGATGGLGREVTRALLKVHAKMILLGRDSDQMRAFIQQLTTEFPNAEIENVTLDLLDLRSIYAAATQLVGRRIDYLLLNAGIYHVPLTQGALGYNNVFQVNFISQYYLTKLLLPALQRTQGKVVAVSSLVHSWVTLNENDVDYTKNAKARQVYANSKRYLTLALSEFFKDRDDVRLALVHPGITLTPMTNAKNNKLIAAGMKLLFPKPAVAALNIVRGVFLDINADEWIGPKVAKIWGEPTVSKLPAATAAERAKAFNLAENVCKLIENAPIYH